MSYYIIIRGPLGVGKSTISKKLAKTLDAEYVPIDQVLEKYRLDKVPKGAECIPAKNFIKADEKILSTLDKKLQKGKKVIFDACFYHKAHITHIIKKLSYPHQVFTLKAPLKTCIGRDSRRKKTHGKDAARAVHKRVSRFDYGKVINTENKTIKETVGEILGFLPKTHLKK